MPGISVTNKCNNKCVMCTNPDEFLKKLSGFDIDSLIKRLEKFKNGSNEFLENFGDAFYLSGGEPTISKNLVRSLYSIDQLFPASRIICLTNGRMFVYADFAKKILKCIDRLELIVPLHGHSQDLHDRITRTHGSFNQTLAGLDNIFRLRKSGHHLIEIRIVIHRLNYLFLKDILQFIYLQYPQTDRIVLIFFEIEGQAEKCLSLLDLTYPDTKDSLLEFYKYRYRFKEIRLYHFPLCTLPTQLFPFTWRTLPAFEVTFLKKCRTCEMKKYCLGIPKNYLRYHDDSEFQPLPAIQAIIPSGNWHHPITHC